MHYKREGKIFRVMLKMDENVSLRVRLEDAETVPIFLHMSATTNLTKAFYYLCLGTDSAILTPCLLSGNLAALVPYIHLRNQINTDSSLLRKQQPGFSLKEGTRACCK